MYYCLATKYFILLLTIMSIQYCVCVCVCVCVCLHSCSTHPHANRISSAPLCIVVSTICLSLPDIFHFMSQRAPFSGDGGLGNLLNTERVFCFILQLTSETFLIRRRLQRDIITNGHTGFHVKYPSLRFV